jgi:cytosine/adenosine deaminase-related metal-dependent hydrolase
MNPARPFTVSARWIIPGDRPPISGGVITMHGGRITVVNATRVAPCDLELPDAAILPGLVNAHAHLDLGGLSGRLPPMADFVSWLRAVVTYRRSATQEQVHTAIEHGIRSSLASGTTLIGDISAGGQSAELIAASPLRGVCFHELIGLKRDRGRSAWREAMRWLAGQPRVAGVCPGLSPHAPYSVRRGLFRAAARRSAAPLAIHFAETPFEEELLHRRRGPPRQFLEELGAWDERGLARSLKDIDAQHRPGRRRLYVHANHVPEPLLDRWADDTGVAVVHCPRTHAYFGRPAFPFAAFASRSILIALGTDSLASNPDLSMLAEARFLWRQGRHDPQSILQMATNHGARALGYEGETGSLTPGKRADWIAVPMPDAADRDPIAAVLSSESPPSHVVAGGEWVCGEGRRVIS